MVKLRLKRYGRKGQVSYRIVAAPALARRDGRALEEVGFYNPRVSDPTQRTRLNVPAIIKWLKQGAQPTPTVRSILEKAQIFDQLHA
ncbi:30S ribosomal protein S16 [Gloeomargarita sp.]